MHKRLSSGPRRKCILMRQTPLLKLRSKLLPAQRVVDDEPTHTPRLSADGNEASYCDDPGNGSRDLAKASDAISSSRTRRSEVKHDGRGLQPY